MEEGGMHLESEFTAPRAECPHPRYWHAPDDMATELEVTALVGALVVALQPELVVEAGTWNGDTSEVIGEALRRNGHGHLHTLEIDETRATEAREKLVGLPVTVHHASSHEYTPPGHVDLLWIDGDPDRLAEWKSLGKYLAKHGIVVFHDTGAHREARKQLDTLPGITLVHLPTPRGVSIGQWKNR